MPASAISVDVSKYLNTHGKMPRGWGNWFFIVPGFGEDTGVWAQNMTYSAACRYARQRAAKNNWPRLQVQP